MRISAGEMAQSIGNTHNVVAGTNTGMIGSNNAINISGEFNLGTLFHTEIRSRHFPAVTERSVSVSYMSVLFASV